MVAENGLTPIRANGYQWAFLPTEDGYDTYAATVEIEAGPWFVYNTANPAAGADPAQVSTNTLTGATNKYVLLTGVLDTMVSDANVADRYPYLTIWYDGSTGVQYFMATTPQTASLTQYWSFAPGTGQSGAIGNNLRAVVGFGLPGVWLRPGGYVQLRYLNIQAGDDASAASFTYRVFP